MESVKCGVVYFLPCCGAVPVVLVTHEDDVTGMGKFCDEV